MRFSVVAQNDVEIRKTHITLDATTGGAGGLFQGTEPNYTDIKLVDVDSGEVLVGPLDVDTSDDLTQDLDFSDIWNLESGVERNLAWTADIANFVPTSDTITLTFNKFVDNEIKNLENNQWVDPDTIVPSSDIIGNTHKVITASTTLSKAGTPGIMTYINGSTGLDFTGVVVRAGNAKDVYLKSLTVLANGTGDCSTEKDCIAKVKLFNGTTQLGTDKSLTGDSATFSSLNLKIAKGTSVTLMIKADLSKAPMTLGGDTLQLNVSAVSLQDIDGNSISAAASIPVTGNIHNISTEGSLTVQKAANESGVTDSRIVVAGQAGVTLAKFRFTAARESLKLSKVPVFIDAATKEVKNMYLYDGSTMVAGPVTPDEDGYAYFTSFTSDFVIPKDESKTLSVVADLSTTTEGAVSGTGIRVWLDNALADSVDFGDEYDFEARSAAGSNTTLNFAGTVDVSGNTVVVRKSKITLAKLALSDTLLTNNSEEELYKFSVEADSAGDVAIKQLKFNVNFNDGGSGDTLELSDINVYDGSSRIDYADMELLSENGTDLENNNLVDGVDAVLIVKFVDELMVAKGTTKTFKIQATPVGFDSPDSNESVTLSLNYDNVAQSTASTFLMEDLNGIVQLIDQDLLAVPEDANILWTDYGYWDDGTFLPAVESHSYDSAPGATSDSSNDWINSFLVKSLPIGSSTISN
jgi:hypothetical protein